MSEAMNRPFDHLVFDLDDTLLDTFQQLIPQAARESCRAMIEAGLATDEDSCLAERNEFVRTHPRQGLYKHLVQRFGVRPNVDPNHVAQLGYDAFHIREVESNIDLFPGAKELVHELAKNYRVHLVTAGNRPTQAAKIRILGISELFESIHHVDPTCGLRKRDAFQAIMSRTCARPERCLSIGNRLDTDISEAKILGWKTCWVRYGEYAHMKPRDEFETPDFEIDQIRELRAACGL